MATTPIYGFEVPDDTDLVKDGALAMRDLGGDVDTTLGTALNSKLHAGLVLIKTQTIGTTVSSVTVTDAFSATYDDYKITISGGVASAQNVLSMKMGATATGYYSARLFYTYAAAAVTAGNSSAATSWAFVGGMTANGLSMDIDLFQPFTAKQTTYTGVFNIASTTGSVQNTGGYLDNTTSYTDFEIIPNLGTLTGGKISVYGYAKD
jgi:hypothetical protein